MDAQVKKDIIIEVEIDGSGKLHIKPERTQFTLIYRTATEVSWDIGKKTLYSPIPREWSCLGWYNHIVNVAKNECFCELLLSEDTEWINVPEELKNKITKAQQGL